MSSEGIAMGFTLLIMVVLYFVPTIIAVDQKRKQKVAIFLLNLFLGWTIIGWIAALIWACVKD